MFIRWSGWTKTNVRSRCILKRKMFNMNDNCLKARVIIQLFNYRRVDLFSTKLMNTSISWNVFNFLNGEETYITCRLTGTWIRLTFIDVFSAKVTRPTRKTGAFILLTSTIKTLFRFGVVCCWTRNSFRWSSITWLICWTITSITVEKIFTCCIWCTRRRSAEVFQRNLTSSTRKVRRTETSKCFIVSCWYAGPLIVTWILLTRIDWMFTKTTFVT